MAALLSETRHWRLEYSHPRLSMVELSCITVCTMQYAQMVKLGQV
jgi:hypothetical protein